MSEDSLGFAHRFLPGDGSGVTLLLLHGTGGDENDLMPLGRELAPGAALLSPRGKVSEHGAPRFFRRLAEGVFDEEDLIRRTHELASFVEAATGAYGLDPEKILAAGYSNGANIAASLLLLHPGLLRGAVLFRAMVPLQPETTPDLAATPIFMASGRRDQIIPPNNTERLARMLSEAGADVELRWRNTGHALTYEEVAEAREWLSKHFPEPQ
jgi:phospholipase/carboxylesterase